MSTIIERVAQVKAAWMFILPGVFCPPDDQLARACSRWDYELIEYAILRTKARLEKETQDSDKLWRFTVGILLNEEKSLSNGARRYIAGAAKKAETQPKGAA